MADYSIQSVAPDGLFTFSGGLDPAKVYGMEALVQQVLIELLSDQSTRLRRGAGLSSAILFADVTNTVGARLTIVRAVDIARSHILDAQRLVRLPDTEKLRDLTLVSAVQDGSLWRIALRITNVAGETRNLSQVLGS